MRLIAILFPAALFSSSVHCFEFVVDQFAIDAVDNAPGDGLCDAALLNPGSGGQCTLRAAIMETNSLPGADTILIPLRDPTGIPHLEGLGLPVSEPIILDLQGEDDFAALGDLDIRDDLTISASPEELIITPSIHFDQVLPVIDASSLDDRIIEVVSGVADVQLHGLVLRDGSAGAGGGVLVQPGITGEVTLQAVDLVSNFAGSGSAVYTQSPMSIINSRMRENVSLSGGVVRAEETEVIIGLSSIYDNVTPMSSGGIVVARGPGFSPASIQMLSSSIIGNSGDAIEVQGNALAQLQNVTISDNRIGVQTSVVSGATSPPSLIMSHTVLANSSVDNCSFFGAIIQSVDDFNLDDTNSCQEIAAGSTNFSDTPAGLSSVQSDALSWHWVATPEEGSLLIDSGSETTVASSMLGCFSFDQRFAMRPRYGIENADQSEPARCDIGAIEVVPERLFANGFEP